MRVLNTGLIICAMIILAACAERVTDYGEGVDPNVSAGWRFAGVQVVVPSSLTVSEAGNLLPDADIVWHGDPMGNRLEQVGTILGTGVSAGGKGLRGSRPVILQVTLQQFHALSPRARRTTGGIHNIDFVIQVIDASTGKPLTEPDLVQADEYAFGGAEAVAAERAGQTQKVRIQNRIALVVAAWLALEPARSTVAQGRDRTLGR